MDAQRAWLVFRVGAWAVKLGLLRSHDLPLCLCTAPNPAGFALPCSSFACPEPTDQSGLYAILNGLYVSVCGHGQVKSLH